MEWLTFTLVAYMELLVSQEPNRLMANTDSQHQQVQLELAELTIDFWLVDNKVENVCQQQKKGILSYSRCTVQAKSVFTQLCQFLQANESSRKLHQRIYCQASQHYQPVIAELKPVKAVDFLLEAKQRCNAAIITAMQKKTKAANAARQKACIDYQLIQGNLISG